MTEPNEPKIVHFQPRAQAPVQDTAGNWEPNEQLFGLEELLQQLPHRKQKSHRVMKAMMTTVKMIVRTTATVQIQMFSMTRMETM